MGRKVDVAREYNFITDFLIEIQAGIDNESIRKELTKKLQTQIASEKKRILKEENKDKLKKLLQASEITENTLRNLEESIKYEIQNRPKIKESQKNDLSPQKSIKNSSKSKRTTFSNTTIPDVVDHSNLPRFLYELNGGNIFMSTTTHSIDKDMLENLLLELNIQEYDFNKHLKKIRNYFFELKEKYPIPKNIFAFLAVYYIAGFKDNEQDKAWSEAKIKVGWSKKSLIDWAEKYPKIVPNPNTNLGTTGCILDEQIFISETGEFLNSFNDVNAYFKKQIYLTTEYLEQLLSYKFSQLKEDYKEKLELVCNLKLKPGVQFFTYSQRVGQLVHDIVKSYLDRFEEKKKNLESVVFEIELTTIEKEIKLSIFNNDLDYTKEENEIKSRRLYGNNSIISIIPKANGLCKIDVIAKLPSEKVVKFQFWPNQDDVTITPSEEIKKGVKHILTFIRE